MDGLADGVVDGSGTFFVLLSRSFLFYCPAGNVCLISLGSFASKGWEGLAGSCGLLWNGLLEWKYPDCLERYFVRTQHCCIVLRERMVMPQHTSALHRRIIVSWEETCGN